MDLGKDKRGQTFLSVAGENPLALPSDDVPDAHVGVIASGDQRPSSSSERANCMLMTLQMKLVIGVFVYILL